MTNKIGPKMPDMISGLSYAGAKEKAGQMGGKLIKEFKIMIDHLKAGRWTSSARECHKLRQEIHGLTSMSAEASNKLQRNPSIEVAQHDIHTRMKIDSTIETLLANMKGKKGENYKEVKNELETLQKANKVGIQFDAEFLNKTQKAAVTSISVSGEIPKPEIVTDSKEKINKAIDTLKTTLKERNLKKFEQGTQPTKTQEAPERKRSFSTGAPPKRSLEEGDKPRGAISDFKHERNLQKFERGPQPTKTQEAPERKRSFSTGVPPKRSLEEGNKPRGAVRDFLAEREEVSRLGMVQATTKSDAKKDAIELIPGLIKTAKSYTGPGNWTVTSSLGAKLGTRSSENRTLTGLQGKYAKSTKQLTDANVLTDAKNAHDTILKAFTQAGKEVPNNIQLKLDQLQECIDVLKAK